MEILLSVGIGLMSMLAYGFANAFSQPISRSIGAAQMLFLRGFTACAILAVAALPDLLTQAHNPNAMAATFLLGMLGYIPVLAFTHGIKISRLGIVAPIAGTSPLITVVLAFLFLGSPINSVQWLAILVIIIANIMISVNAKNWRESNLLRLSSGIPYAIIAAVGWGLFFFYFIYATQALGPWVATLLVEMGVVAAAGFHIWITKQPIKWSDARRGQVMLNAILITCGTVTFSLGVRYFNVGIVAALSNSTALIAALLGAYLFHERLNTKEKIAAGLMIAGVATIALAG